LRRKRLDESMSRHGVRTVRPASGRAARGSVRTTASTHFACVAAGFVLLFSRMEYGQSGTVFGGQGAECVCDLWQQESELV
jgi:hypothetical protein